MVKLLAREAAFVLLTGLFAAVAFPYLLGGANNWSLFGVGFLMALTFAAVYAMLMMGAERTPPRWRPLVAVLAWSLAFARPDERLLMDVIGVEWRVLYVNAAPALFGLIVMVVAAMRAKAGHRFAAAFAASMAYSVPMAGVRWLLMPLVSANPTILLLTLQSGAFYMLLRVVGRIFWPFSVEGGEGKLIHRPVPDPIVGLVEGTTRRRARPFVTMSDGRVDEGGISIRCRPDEAESVADRLRESLQGKPFIVEVGPLEADQTQIVVRPDAR